MLDARAKADDAGYIVRAADDPERHRFMALRYLEQGGFAKCEVASWGLGND